MNRKISKLNLIAVVSAIIIVLLWFGTIGLLGNWSLERRGTFGDMFGSVNALFSGLALAGIIYTILLQREELSLQRKELRDTRKEFVEQNKTLRLQRFDNTFFNMLQIHHEIIDKLSLKKVSNLYILKRECNQ